MTFAPIPDLALFLPTQQIAAFDQTIVLDSPSHSVHLNGVPAILFLLIVFGIVAALVMRYLIVHRRARTATSAHGAAQAELRTLFAAMQDVVFVVDSDGRFARVPLTNADALYRLRADIIGKQVGQVLPAEAADTICTISAQVIATQQTVQNEFRMEFNGHVVWFAATASPFDAQSVLWVARDTTETKTARDALAQSESRYRLLFDRNPCAMWVYDYDTTRIIEANDAAVAQYGFSREEFARMTLNDLRPPEEIPHLAEILKEMPYNEPSVHLVRHRTKSGEILDAEVRGHPLGVAGRNLRLLVSTDMTERIRTDRIIRAAESRATATNQMLQALIDTAPQAMIVMDPQWRITRWNGAAEGLFGWLESEVNGKALPIIPEDQRELTEAWNRVLEQGAVTKPVETVRIRRDGKRLDVMVAIAPLLGAESRPTAFIAVYMDLTERKQLEEQLRQSQKMEAIGTLAGGVAHDFNNILTVISSYSGLLLADDRYPDIRSDIEEISTAARRATGLTRQLLTFSRKAIVQLGAIDLNSVVTEMRPMIRRLLMEHIELDVKLEDDISQVIADPSQIEQILLNLVVNASDAMPDGGSLVIETQNIRIDEAYADVHSGVLPGDYVLLAVTDTGTGIDQETIRKIFEPFFTTKEVGRGTGLGLATVYAIVKQLNGHVWVYSEPQHGATFKVYLPHDKSAAVQAIAPVKEAPDRGTATVLLVEDDNAVRRATKRMLGKAGFTVIEAENGEAGLEVASSYDGDIDVVVTDLMMPKMNGGDFAAALADSHPGLRVLFTSGYTDDAVLRRGLVNPAHAFVQKPFAGETLVKAILSLLESPVGS